MKDPLVHFEVPFDDFERASAFYQELFGWEIAKESSMNYWHIKARTDVGIDGGMLKRMYPGQGIMNYVDVSSVDEHTAKVQRLGGKIVVPKTPVPGVGWFAIIQDTEGNAIGMFQMDEGARKGP